MFNGTAEFDSADVAIATQWWTAFAVRDLPRCREKVYLVQDPEDIDALLEAQQELAKPAAAPGRCRPSHRRPSRLTQL